MPYELNLGYEKEHDTISAHVCGQMDYHARVEMWKEIAEFCDRHGCHDVLIETDAASVPAAEAYQYSAILEAAGIDSKYQLAVVANNPDALESVEFVDLVLKSKGVNVGNTFKDAARARNWLKRKSEA